MGIYGKLQGSDVLFDPAELESVSPLFRGCLGHSLAVGLMHVLAIDKINDLYGNNISLKGPDFTSAVLNEIGVKYDVLNPEVLNDLPSGPFITISNHPYGSIDGVMLVDLFGHLRPDFKVMVNSFLGRIKTLEENFICVTPAGSHRGTPTKDSLHGVRDAIAHVYGGHPLGIFPSGAVSDLSVREHCIRDREWQESVVRLIYKLGVPIVPVHFLDRNSDFYYLLGLLDWRIRLLRLPSEVFNKRGKCTRIALGPVMMPQRLSGEVDIYGFRDYLREKVYTQY